MTAIRRAPSGHPHRRPAAGRGEPYDPTPEILKIFAILFLLITLVAILREHLGVLLAS